MQNRQHSFDLPDGRVVSAQLVSDADTATLRLSIGEESVEIDARQRTTNEALSGLADLVRTAHGTGFSRGLLPARG